MTALSTDNPDIAACVAEIKQAITLQDQDALARITTIVTKYLAINNWPLYPKSCIQSKDS
jgi:hypothetical protein